MARSALALFLCLGCGGARVLGPEEGSVEETWNAATRARIDAVIAARGRGSATFDAARPPVVVLDWDNTTMRGDIGELSFAFALERGLLRVPADWSALEPLTPAAIGAATTACTGLSVGDRVPAAGPCADWLAHVALEGTLPTGEDAFVTPITRTSNASYAFLGQLFTGLGPFEVGAIGREAFDLANARPIGATLTPGGVEITGFARIQPPVRALVLELRDAGFDVWVVSASHQALVHAIASEAGVAEENVIGLRPWMDRGLYAVGWEDPAALGEGPERASGAPVIDYHEGKRAWIQRVIFGMRGPAVLEPHATNRPAIALGDADTDLGMLESADLAILFDRHRVRVTCRALAEPARFIVHPLFVAPPEPRTEPYPCSTHTDALGPIVGPDGAPIPDLGP